MKMEVPSGQYASKVSPRIGLNGFNYLQAMCNPETTIVITFFILSSGSLLSAAAFRYVGPVTQKSQILSIVERFSKILTGSEIATMPLPSINFFPTLFKISTKIPL
jgi:hypothetical protein